ncbi:MAG: hypothetical protein OEZ68_16300 [Gammaproteobacteria bacterium]|nr:hypothetical protein [Gammaproteobacteria bacterium]MDH5802363.1 hypothetical protein [Gammaproteobacteria bacterium]
MHERLEGLPVYELRQWELDANYFNHVQVALHRLSQSLRFAIPKLKHLDLILDADAWIVVDRVQGDVPVVAWTAFQTQHRDNLFEPIKCELRSYHAHADLILQRTLEAMELLLGEQLADGSFEANNVIEFRSS